jgi:hypothetical protein
MIGRIRSRVSSAHLVAVVALVFAAAGGTALALPGVNRVNSGDVKNGTLRGIDIKNNSLTGADIKESTLNGNAIPGAAGPQGPPGPPGPAGGGVSGATPLFFNAVAGTGATVLYNANGLELRALCSAGLDLDAVAETASDNSEIISDAVDGGELSEEDFDTVDGALNILSATEEDAYVFSFHQGGSAATVSGEFAAWENSSHSRCQVFGHLVAG